MAERRGEREALISRWLRGLNAAFAQLVQRVCGRVPQRRTRVYKQYSQLRVERGLHRSRSSGFDK